MKKKVKEEVKEVQEVIVEPPKVVVVEEVKDTRLEENYRFDNITKYVNDFHSEMEKSYMHYKVF